MSKVFGVHEPPPYKDYKRDGALVEKDLSSAQRYGQLMFLLNRADRPSTMPGPCLRKIQQGLKDFTPEDYLFFPGGDHVGLMLTGTVLRDMGFREVQWLKWEKERDTQGKLMPGGFYVPIKITLP